MILPYYYLQKKAFYTFLFFNPDARKYFPENFYKEKKLPVFLALSKRHTIQSSLFRFYL